MRDLGTFVVSLLKELSSRIGHGSPLTKETIHNEVSEVSKRWQKTPYGGSRETKRKSK